MVNLFRREERKPAYLDRTEPSSRSSVAVVVNEHRKGSVENQNARPEDLIPPSRLQHSTNAMETALSTDWSATLGAPTGVTDDRSDASPREAEIESTLPSQDSYADATAVPTPSAHRPPKDTLLRSPKNGLAKIFAPPVAGATPRSSNTRGKDTAAATGYVRMDDNKHKQRKGTLMHDKDGILRTGSKTWWSAVRSRISGKTSTHASTAVASTATEPLHKPPTRKTSLSVSTEPSETDEPDPADISFLTRMGVFLCSSAIIYMILFVGMAAGLTYGTMNQLRFFSNIDWDEQISVAFIGTSYLFVNDVPRLLETMGGGQVIQDSCLRSGGSLATVVLSGNGMYNRWQTNEALINSNEQDDFYSTVGDDADGNSSHPLYDFGACSVHQLLAGYDNYLQYGNDNGAYSDDGNNPCLVDENYYRYVGNKYAFSNAPSWDYVVLADQSKRMAASSDMARYDTIDALVNVYAPLLLQAGSIPVIVDTHAFWSSHTNMTGLDDVPTFARMIYQGVDEYVSALSAELPADQEPVVVPIGLAYLLIWEENYSLWEKLFLSDEMHSSLAGSYLFACVLYTKLFGHLPKRSTSLPRRMEYLFAYCRRTIGADPVYPSQSEAEYLRGIAKRIVLDGEVPISFIDAATDDGNSDNR